MRVKIPLCYLRRFYDQRPRVFLLLRVYAANRVQSSDNFRVSRLTLFPETKQNKSTTFKISRHIHPSVHSSVQFIATIRIKNYILDYWWWEWSIVLKLFWFFFFYTEQFPNEFMHANIQMRQYFVKTFILSKDMEARFNFGKDYDR